MHKTFLLCIFALNLSAQTLFQKKLEGLQSAEGMALMPDGGFVVAGLKANCIQIIRFGPSGAVVWMHQSCPNDPNADLTIAALQLAPDPIDPGAFFLMFRKGAFFSAPDHLLNAMKFDASGALLWEQQLRPDRRYGGFSPGRQLALTPNASIWAAHGMGFTDSLPDFNQALVFKVSPGGQILLRRYFMTDTPSMANGITAFKEDEIYAYGALGRNITGGFILKINALGEVVWANRYAGINFLQDGGYFSNGDLLFMAEYNDAYALTRIASDGSLVWAKRLVGGPNLFHCSVAPDGGILLAGKMPDSAAMLLKISADASALEWAKTYETCTQYPISALSVLPNGNIAFAQSSIVGIPVSRVLVADEFGQISSACLVRDLLLPEMENIPGSLLPLQFTWLDAPIAPVQKFFSLSETQVEITNCCPTEYPAARFEWPDSVCVQAPFSLRSKGNTCADDLRWSFPGAVPNIAEGAVFQDIILEKEGEYPVQLIEHFGTCSDTFLGAVRAVAPISAAFFLFKDTLICPDTPFEVQAHLSGFDAWIWDDGSTDSTRLFNPPRPGNYSIQASQGLCTAKDSFQIQVGNCGPSRVFAPNVFAPNEDGANDVWEIYFQPGLRPLQCQVFDRWGNLCYASDADETPRWDGYFNGKLLQSSVFVWQLRFLNAEGKEEFLRGDLLLVR